MEKNEFKKKSQVKLRKSKFEPEEIFTEKTKQKKTSRLI